MNNESRPHFKPGAVKYTKGYGRKVFFSKLTTFSIALLSIITIGLTIFIYIKQPIRTENGFTQADPIHNRMPKIGERVLIVESETYNMLTPLSNAVFAQDLYEAEIIAGPYGEFKTQNGNNVVVHGNKTISVNVEVNLESDDEKYLDQEYVVRKTNVSEDKIITRSEIMGNVKSDITNN